jgi:hypothetical protein
MTEKSRMVLGITVLSALLFVAIYWKLEEHNRRVNYPNPGYDRLRDLKQIGLGMYMYAQNFGEYLPPTLSLLYPDYISDPGVLVGPEAVREGEGQESWTAYRYYYLLEGQGAVIADIPTKPAVLNSFIAGDRIYYCVLFLDGHVEYVSERSEITNLFEMAKPRRKRHGG